MGLALHFAEIAAQKAADKLRVIVLKPTEHKWVEAHHHDLAVVGLDKVVDLAQEPLVHLVAVGFDLAVNGHAAAGGKCLRKGGNALLCAKERQLLQLRQGKLTNRAVDAADPLQAVVVKDDYFAVGGKANVKLHRKVLFSGKPERRKAVFGNLFIVIITAVAVNRWQIEPTELAGVRCVDKKAGADKKNYYEHQ